MICPLMGLKFSRLDKLTLLKLTWAVKVDIVLSSKREHACVYRVGIGLNQVPGLKKNGS